MRRSDLAAPVLLLALAVNGCSSAQEEGDASLSVLLESEDVIIDGLAAGDRPEDIRDGWSVNFDKYIVGIGHVTLHPTAGGGDEVEAPGVFAIDLTQVSPGGEPLWRLDGLSSGSYDFGYSTAIFGATRTDSVSEVDFAHMVDEDWTYLVSGTLENEEGSSCPPPHLAAVPEELVANGENSAGDPCYPAARITFAWGLEAEAAYGPCEIDGIAGVTTTSGATSSVAITIHGDHLFFNGFPEGSEGGVMRLAQWLADCDLDLDGTVTQEELESIAPSDLTELDDRFQLGGAPLTPLDNMMTYLRAQALTQGHFQGEGECALNGETHEH